MKKQLLHIVLFFCIAQQLYSQEDGVVAFNIPARNSLKFNRHFINPTFSFVREQNKYISFNNKREWVQFNDAPQTYLFGYSGRFRENIGIGVSLFQQNYGVLTTFGGVLNFAYNAVLDRDSNLTFGLNLGFYKSGINEGNVITNFPDSSLDNIPSNSIITINPGINYGTGFFDFGVSLKNIVSYNLTSSKMIEDNPEQGIQGHIMYTGYFNTRGFFDESRFTSLISSEFKKDQTVVSGMVMLMVPKGIWMQAGYNSLSALSAGIGLNISSQIAVEYNFEKGVGGFSAFGNSHDITLAYKFNNKYRYDYSGDDDEEALLISSNKKSRNIAKRRKTTKKQPSKETKPVVVESNDINSDKIAEEEQARIAEAARVEAAAAQAKAVEDARIQAETEEQKRLAEAARVQAAAAQAQAVEDARIQAETEEQKRLAEAARVQAAAQAKAVEDARIQAETEEQKRLTEAARIQAEAEEQERLAEAARVQAAAAQAKAVEAARIQAEAEEQERLAEAARVQVEAAAQAKAVEDARIQAEAEEQERLAEAARVQAEVAAQAKAVEDARIQAEAEEQERLAEAARVQAEAAAQAKAVEDARIQAEAEEQERLAEVARVQAEEEAKAKLAIEEKDRLEKEAQIKAIALDEVLAKFKKSTEASKNNQQELLDRLNEKVASKQQDLDDLKEENDLSEKGIVSAPKAFKSVSAENAVIESLKLEVDNSIELGKRRITTIENLYRERLKKVKSKDDAVNKEYLRAIETLKAEQQEVVSIKQNLVSNLKDIKKATDFERNRRIKRAAYDNQDDRYNKDRAALERIKRFTKPSSEPLTNEDFDFGETLSNIQIVKNVDNEENGYYLVVAIHNDIKKRDEFLEKAIAAGEKNINFFFDVNTSKYYIYYDKFDNINQAKSKLDTDKGSKPYNGKMSMVKIEN